MPRNKYTDFSIKTKTALALRSGYICSNPDCRKQTATAHSDKNKYIILGEAAHIAGPTIKSARYDSVYTNAQFCDIENGIWLCRDCHKKVDMDEKKYSDLLLKKWKKYSESTLGNYRGIIQETINEALKSDGFKRQIYTGSNAEVLNDEDIRQSFDEWNKGDINKAKSFAEVAYVKSSGLIKLQAILNIILLTNDYVSKIDYLVSLCDEGIEIATATKAISTRGVLKAHKAMFLNHKVFESSLGAYSEAQIRKLTGFPTMANHELSLLASTMNQNSEMVQKLAKESQEDAIRVKDYEAMAHIKMTLASTMGQMYLLTKQIGGNYGAIEHYVTKTYLEAKEIYETLKNYEGIAYVLHNLSNNLRFFGNLNLAIKLVIEAKNHAKTTNNKELQNKLAELEKRLVMSGLN